MKKIIISICALFMLLQINAKAEEAQSKKKQTDDTFWGKVLSLPLEPVKGSADFVHGQIFNLGPITVSGSRVSSNLADAKATDLPRNITIVGEEEIAKHPGGSLSEILAAKEGVTLSDDLGQGLNARLDLRGFGGEAKQVLVLFDGLRAVEPFDNSMTWSLYPAEYMKQVEIRRGGGSTVYGEGALSGVVSLETKDPTKHFHVAVENSLGSYNTDKNFVEASGTVNGLGFYWAARYFNTGGYRQNSDNENTTTLLKNTYAITDLVDIENQFYFANGKTGIPGPLSAAETDQDRRQKDPDGQFGDRFSDELVQNGFKVNYFLERINVMVTNLFGYRFRRQDSDQSFGGSFPGRSLNHIKTITYSDVIQADWQTEGDFYKSNFDTGMEWAIDDISNPFTFNDFTFGPFGSERAIDRRMMGFFIQDRVELWDRLILEAGTRYDKINWDIYDLLSPALEKHKKTEHWSPSVGVQYKLWQPLSVYGSYSQSFKVPDSNTLIFETPNIFSPNPNIDPSVAHHYEAGARYAHPVFGSMRAAYFYIKTDKEILFDDITNTNENFDTIRQGLELGNEVRVLDGVDLIANYTYTNAKFEEGLYDSKSIPLVPKNTWSLGVRATPLKELDLYVVANGVADQYALNDFNNIFKMESYWTLDSRISFRKNNWEVYMRADNLLGEKYSSFATSDGVTTLNLNPSPGRYFEGGFKVEI